MTNQPSPSVPAFTMPPRPAPPGSRINKVTSSYAGLLKTVRDAGMLRRCQRYYLVLLTILVVMGTGIWVVFFLLGDSWLQLAVAGASGVVFTHQGYLLFPLLLFLGWTLHIDSLKYLLRRAPVKYRWLEMAMLVLRSGAYVGLLFLVLSPAIAVAFIAVQIARP
ncbi:hypothetical protein AB4Z38_07770 [Arthrobacter sp. 2RAF6]|uniref:hypothetical protein n=1 Tax=Arthrobacter sp. 2RAF6 TaxID=3233002 RepID=UPI003F90955E